MGKLPEKYEDWRLPDFLNGDGDVDLDRVGRLIFNARKAEELAKEKLESETASKDEKIAQLEADLTAEKARKSGTNEEGQAELIALRKENGELKEKAGKPDADSQKTIDKLNVVIDLVDQGLPKALALRVQGDDKDAMLEDAKTLAQVAGVEFGNEQGGDDDGDEAGGEGGAPSQRPISTVRSGFEGGRRAPVQSNPQKAAEALPALFS